MTDQFAALLAPLLAAVEGHGFVAALRGSVWLYPLVNTAHVIGIALLFGSIVPLDLRLLGVWKGVPVGLLTRVLRPVAATGLVLAVLAGALLFVTRATEYAASGFFQAKLLLIVLAAANALALNVVPAARVEERGPAVRASALLSIASWSGIILLGRLVGYF